MGISDRVLVSGKDVLALIPQRPPIVMIDRLFWADESGAGTGLSVEVDNMFVEEGFLQESGLLEHVAQSCAARIGYLCACNHQPVPVGFIGAVSHFTFHFLPRVGDTLCTDVHVEQELFDVSLVSAKVFEGDRLVADGYLKIAIKNTT